MQLYLLLAVSLSLLLCKDARADTIVLKNGRRIVALSVAVEGDKVRYLTSAGELALPKSIVDHIEKGGAGQMPASPSAGAANLAITPPSIDSSQFTVTICGVQGGTVCSDSTAPACLSGNTLFKAINYPGCITSVQVQYTYNFIFPLVSAIPIHMSSTSEMTIVH